MNTKYANPTPSLNHPQTIYESVMNLSEGIKWK